MAASRTCTAVHVGLQPVPTRVAPFSAQGCSLHHVGLQGGGGAHVPLQVGHGLSQAEAPPRRDEGRLGQGADHWPTELEAVGEERGVLAAVVCGEHLRVPQDGAACSAATLCAQAATLCMGVERRNLSDVARTNSGATCCHFGSGRLRRCSGVRRAAQARNPASPASGQQAVTPPRRRLSNRPGARRLRAAAASPRQASRPPSPSAVTSPRPRPQWAAQASTAAAAAPTTRLPAARHVVWSPTTTYLQDSGDPWPPSVPAATESAISPVCWGQGSV